MDNQNSGEIHALMDWVFAGHLYMHVRSSINPKEEYLSGLFSKKIWLVLGAGAVRNRTYRGGGTGLFCQFRKH